MIEFEEVDGNYVVFIKPCLRTVNGNFPISYGLEKLIDQDFEQYEKIVKNYNATYGMEQIAFFKNKDDANRFIEEWLMPQIMTAKLLGKIV